MAMLEDSSHTSPVCLIILDDKQKRSKRIKELLENVFFQEEFKVTYALMSNREELMSAFEGLRCLESNHSWLRVVVEGNLYNSVITGENYYNKFGIFETVSLVRNATDDEIRVVFAELKERIIQTLKNSLSSTLSQNAKTLQTSEVSMLPLSRRSRKSRVRKGGNKRVKAGIDETRIRNTSFDLERIKILNESFRRGASARSINTLFCELLPKVGITSDKQLLEALGSKSFGNKRIGRSESGRWRGIKKYQQEVLKLYVQGIVGGDQG